MSECFNGNLENGRFEDIIPEDQFDARCVLQIMKYKAFKNAVAFYDESQGSPY